MAKSNSRSLQNRLVYQSVLDAKQQYPAWVDMTLKKALNADPNKRYAELSEFIQDLRRPNPDFVNQLLPPLLERNPVRFWQGVSAILAMVIIVMIANQL